MHCGEQLSGGWTTLDRVSLADLLRSRSRPDLRGWTPTSPRGVAVAGRGVVTTADTCQLTLLLLLLLF